MLKNFNKKNSFFNIMEPAMDVFITLIIKIFILRLIITFHKIVISFLRFNEFKSFIQ